jgi:hypothetical protein
MSVLPLEDQREETWSGKTTSCPQSFIENFNMAAVVYKPSGSKLRVLDARKWDKIFVRFGWHDGWAIDEYGNNLLISDHWCVDILMARDCRGRHTNVIAYPELSNHEGNEWNEIVGDLVRQFNASQTKALLQAVTKQFTLIKGPPGTGKTRTLLTAAEALYLARTERILICAPSRTATEHLADEAKQLWTAKQYLRLHVRWARRTADEAHTGYVNGTTTSPMMRQPLVGVSTITHEASDFLKD